MAYHEEEGGWEDDEEQLNTLDAMAGGSDFEVDDGDAEEFDPEALDVHDGEAEGFPAEGDAAHLDVDKEYTGIVSKYFVLKDFGYITCEDIKAACGRDVYVHKRVLTTSKATKGSKVKFTIHLNNQGLPQAQGPMTVLGINPPADYSGSIKSFSANTGYGFVASEKIFTEFGRDAYLPLAKATGYAVGQDVFFNVGADQQGRPIVSEMWPAFGAGGEAGKGAGKVVGGKAGKAAPPRDPNWSPPAAFARPPQRPQHPQSPAPGASGKGPRPAGTYVRQESRVAVNGGGPKPPATRPPPQAAQAEGEITDAASAAERLMKAKTYEGVITKFEMRASRGWIECDEIREALGGDCYVHQNVMAASGAFVGARVQFKVHLNAKGQPQAQAPLTILDGEAPSGYVGVIKSYAEASGYGFVACDETFQEFQRDVFLRKDKAQGFVVGEEVIFNYEVTDDGKPAVSEIWPVNYHEVGKAGGRVIGESSNADAWNSGGAWAADGGWGKGGSSASKGGSFASKGGHQTSKGNAKGSGYASKGKAQWNAGSQSGPARIETSAGGTKRLVAGASSNPATAKGGGGAAGKGAWPIGAPKKPRLY
mmetsp:Transcript_140731/g.262641  ORF Transcript_140731/g.262641 Transcript_140731/m.262641 type:complete len:592 (+) Transcript_140731:112-1887(+)